MRTSSGGRLLDRVCYCMRKPTSGTNIVDEKITVRDTFPYNPVSKTAPETAKRWASPNYYDRNKDYVPEVIERDNTPFSIVITDLHVRSEGGRAYKVIDNEMRRFDLREDQVLEVMKNVGILPGGHVAGTFVWGILGSQVRLVLVGGELHKEMTAGLEEKKQFDEAQKTGQHPTEATLEPGHVYRKKDKSLHVFLGRVKRAGINKTFYAFMEMPSREKPEEVDDSDIDEQASTWANQDPEYTARLKNSRKHDRDMARRWDSLTWREKCKFAWDDTYNMYREPREEKHVHYASIALMSSPKFEADVGEVEHDFFLELRSNPDNRHDYIDGNRNTIVEVEFRKAHPNERGYLGVGDVWQSHSYYGHGDNSKRMTEAWRKAKADFYAGLTWV